MGTKDPRVDAYIDNSEEFAKPILNHIRNVVHGACPDVEETIKWGFPVFEYRGILCNMASFKEHCAFGFWKASLVLDDAVDEPAENAMGQFGRIKSIADLPPEETLAGYIRKAVALNEKGVRPEKSKQKKADPVLPEDFGAALLERSGALAAFKAMPPSHRREYIEWITEAKRESTRRRRIAKAVDQIAEEKSLNWKYE